MFRFGGILLEWVLAAVRIPLLGRGSRKHAGEIGPGGGILCHAEYGDPVAGLLLAGWDSERRKAPLSTATAGLVIGSYVGSYEGYQLFCGTTRGTPASEPIILTRSQ